jgi:signal peptidase I
VNFDFAAILVILCAVSGAIWAFDSVMFAPRRRTRLAGLDVDIDDNGHGKDGLARTLDQPPLIVDYARSFFPIFLIVLLLRSFLVEPFRIPSGSMMPTLLIGDFILVNKYDYGIRLPVLNSRVVELGSPERGDVIVFRYPEDPSIPYIKRVVGVPGDTIEYRNKVLYINGEELRQDNKGTYIGVGAGTNQTGTLVRSEVLNGVEHEILIDPRRPAQRVENTVPEGHYFVLGDNRDNSKDSRFWGFVPDENLIGRAFMIWMNWDSKNGGIAWSRIGDFIE